MADNFGLGELPYQEYYYLNNKQCDKRVGISINKRNKSPGNQNCSSAKDGQGINVMTPDKGLVDLKKAGVVDPARVTREAVQNAVSIAATTITMGALIVELPNKDDAAAAASMGGGMY